MANLFDLIDGMIKEFYKINDDELDYICEYVTDEELAAFMDALGKLGQKPTITEIKKGLAVRNKYRQLYNESQIQTNS